MLTLLSKKIISSMMVFSLIIYGSFYYANTLLTSDVLTNLASILDNKLSDDLFSDKDNKNVTDERSINFFISEFNKKNTLSSYNYLQLINITKITIKPYTESNSFQQDNIIAIEKNTKKRYFSVLLEYQYNFYNIVPLVLFYLTFLLVLHRLKHSCHDKK